MEKTRKTYIEVNNGIIVGIHSYKPDDDRIAEGCEFKEVKENTNNVENYLGLKESDFIKQSNLDSLEFQPNKKNQIRATLKSLYTDIQFLKDIGEDTSEKEALYEEYKLKYSKLT